MTRTLVLLAEPELDNSQTHQFLWQSGQSITSVDYLDLARLSQAEGGFDSRREKERWAAYDRIVLQFSLYWYQAPALLTDYLQSLWPSLKEAQTWKSMTRHQELGVVLVAGAKANHYQRGGRVDVTLSELLSSYSALARDFEMTFLEPMTIHHFHYLTEDESWQVMWRYACYLETGNPSSFRVFQDYLLAHLSALSDQDLPLDEADQMVFQHLLETMSLQAEELNHLTQWMEDWF